MLQIVNIHGELMILFIDNDQYKKFNIDKFIKLRKMYPDAFNVLMIASQKGNSFYNMKSCILLLYLYDY